MPVQLPIPQRADLLPVAGVRLGHAEAGIRKAGRKDMLVVALDEGSSVAGVFTQNGFAAAPVQVCRAHLQSQQQAPGSTALGIRALVINTGCANAGTGALGLANAQATCAATAQALHIQPHQVLPFSTGVILEHLPMDRLLAGVGSAAAALGSSDWLDAAESIMTTDTQPKAMSRRLLISGRPITISGISKGAGMIKPNMATMLGFVATDLRIAAADLQALCTEAADVSFNAVTVDGDTSTNDSFVMIATGASGIALAPGDAQWGEFRAAMIEVCQRLAQAIVRDGEGATKFITLDIEGATSTEEAKRLGYAIAHSPLVKTAMFASDPNLGRILAAIGNAGLQGFSAEAVRVWLGGTLVAEQGGRAAAYTEAQGQAAMAPAEITIRVDLGRGEVSARLWTCDFSHDYVTINADYRS